MIFIIKRVALAFFFCLCVCAHSGKFAVWSSVHTKLVFFSYAAASILLVSLQWSEQQKLYWSGAIIEHHCLLYLFSLLLFAFTAFYLLPSSFFFLNELLLRVSQKCARKQLNGRPATAIHSD